MVNNHKLGSILAKCKEDFFILPEIKEYYIFDEKEIETYYQTEKNGIWERIKLEHEKIDKEINMIGFSAASDKKQAIEEQFLKDNFCVKKGFDILVINALTKFANSIQAPSQGVFAMFSKKDEDSEALAQSLRLIIKKYVTKLSKDESVKDLSNLFSALEKEYPGLSKRCLTDEKKIKFIQAAQDKFTAILQTHKQNKEALASFLTSDPKLGL